MANTLKFGNGEWYGKKDTILAYNDENSNYKPLPFDFSRASKATVINKDGLIETVGSGIPRIDFLGNTKGALLLEPQRTNLITYSEDFSNAYWTKSGVSVTSGFTSPDGTTNAFKLIASSSNTAVAHNTYSGAVSITSGNTYTQNLFFKYDNHQYIKLQYGATGTGGLTGNQNVVKLDILNKTIIQPDSPSVATITEFSNNWVMVTLTATMAATGNVSTEVVLSNSNWDNASIKVGGESVYIYGAQLEAGSYSTSLINTQGSAVTRLADSCSQTVPDGVIGQTEGTMYAEIDFKSKPEAGSPIVSIMTLNNNVNNLQNCIILGIERQSEGVNRFYPFVQVSNSTVANVIGGTLTDGIYKVAFAYKQNDFVLYVNGVQIGTDTNGVVPTTSQVLVGERYNTDTYKIADGIKETKLYNTRLSNSELAALTS